MVYRFNLRYSHLNPHLYCSTWLSQVRNTFCVSYLRVPHFAQWCSLATGPVVSDFQRFRNTKNTENTGFLTTALPTPRNVLKPAARQPPGRPELARTPALGRGADREARQLFVSAQFTGLDGGGVSAFAVFWVLPIPPSLHGYGDSRFPCS